MKIFISYSRLDKAFASKLAQDLRQVGLDIWLDVEDIPAGTKWSSAIQQGLDSTQLMILVISPNSMTSTNVEDEWQYFIDEGKPIIPVLLEPARIHFQIRRLQHINFHGQDYETSFEKLCNELEIKIGIDLVSTRPGQSSTTKSKRLSSKDIMPQPFDWVDIPEGKVNIEAGRYIAEGGQVFDVPAFTIAKYPLTNAQFAKFVEAMGYHERRWWTDKGWQTRTQKGWMEPRYWHDPTWNKPDYPVIGVSWFEAMSFCTWLTELTGEKITLPTEQQWQRAAQGDTNWTYPWGNEFETGRCNCHGPSTTSVTLYEGKGDSPFKVVDMSGNVWEWCLTDSETGVQSSDHPNSQILRGGSWWNREPLGFGASYRSGGNPSLVNNGWGFRIVRLIT